MPMVDRHSDVVDGAVMWHAVGTGLVPTPSPPLSAPRSSPAFAAPQSFAAHLNALRELRDVAAESKRNKKLLATVPDAVEG